MLYCPNYTCQTANPETHKFCQKCRTLLPKHYLWAVGDGATAYQPDDLLVNRYLCKSPRIFLDTKPGLYPTIPTEIPQEFISYLRLSPYRLHVPQIYDIVPSTVSPTAKIALLDEAAFTVPGFFYSDPTGSQPPDAATGPQLLPALTDLWRHASALRQLNWLWQIAQLWHSFGMERVVSSLLSPELMRTEGALLRMLELRSDGTEVIALPQLGKLWSQWLPEAHVDIAPGLAALCQQLTQGEFRNSEQLLEQLDQLLLTVGRSQARQIQIATRTDQGPSRQRNEDACFPPSGTVKTKTMRVGQPSAATDNTLIIVCDGIGGHQGGDVASNLAIEAVRQQAQSLDPEQTDPTSLMVALEQAVCVANDQISQRNDSEQRYDRQRMGTTLVMGLMRAHELYITHVGDSRAYWITRQGCHQVTLDDDVASREVRLGYSPYREALQQPSAGSLVQALGMGSSSILHPTVQRFVLDEDSIFLLCSDGLSDNDRVEEYWEAVLLPLLEGKTDLNTVAQQLVEIANTRNGHDNVTVGLLYVRVTDSRPTMATQSAKPAQFEDVLTPTLIQHDQATEIQTRLQIEPGADADMVKTRVLPTKFRNPSGTLRLVGLIGLLLGGGGLLVYSLNLSFRNWVDTLVGLTPPMGPDPAPTLTLPSPTASPLTTVETGSFIQLDRNSTTALSVSNAPPSVEPLDEGSAPAVEGVITPGSVVQILKKQAVSSQDLWMQVRVCSTVPTVTPGIEPGGAPSGVPQNLTQSSSPLPLEGANASPPLPSTSAAPSAAPSGSDGSELPIAMPLPPGATGWIQEATILPLAMPVEGVTLAEQGACGDLPPAGLGESSSPLPEMPSSPGAVEPFSPLPKQAEQGVS
jgi:serine/threonine protein phosphatase PrpC